MTYNATKNGAERLEQLKIELQKCKTAKEALESLANFIGVTIRCDRVLTSVSPLVHIWNAAWIKEPDTSGFVLEKSQDLYALFGWDLVSLDLSLPLFVSDVGHAKLPAYIKERCRERGLMSFCLVPIINAGQVNGWIECHCTRKYIMWSPENIFLLGRACEIFSGALTPKPETQQVPQVSDSKNIEELYTRLVQYGNLVVVKTDSSLQITEVLGDSLGILGVSLEDLRRRRDIWGRLFHPRDLRRLAWRLERLRVHPKELNEEIRIVHQKSGEERWILLKGTPLFSQAREFIGWEGFGLDITDKHRTQAELLSQSRRIEALYEVSRSLQANMDPAVATLKGLRALIRATNSDSGLGCLRDSSNSLEIVAAEGLSGQYVEAIAKILNEKTLVRQVVETKNGLLIADLQADPRAAVDLAKMEGVRAAIIMPFMFEQRLLGALVLFCRKPGRYTEADFDLVQAASSQIGLAVHQAELYVAERTQASSLAALYRLSHELSKHLTPREVAEHALPVIQEELHCKRMWFGVLNDQGTHMVGCAGSGPGVRKQIINLQIELNLRHDFFDEAVQQRHAVVVKAGAKMECSGLNKIMEKLQLGTFIIVPLVALGQVVGVVIVEPAIVSMFFAQRRLPLLTSMASEIATVILARRLEAKIADAHKMKMAGLLASGVAHNFNNLLQAIMGQASLVEIQAPEASQLKDSAKMILDASHKGAALVKQLFSLSRQESAAHKHLALNSILQDSRDLYESVLGDKIVLEMNFAEDLPEVYVDAGQIQQVITNLLMNAKEALADKRDARVKLDTHKIRLRSGEVDPELSPGYYIRVDLSDNGVGMDSEKLARCFEPFYSSKNVDARTGISFVGAGLGLSSVYSIMRMHDGFVTVRSQLGEGSTFSLYLPAVTVHTKEAFPATLKLASNPQDYENIIYGFDDSDKFVIKSTIEGLGMTAITVNLADELLELLETPRSGLGLINDEQRKQIVLLDVDRPELDGFSWIMKLRNISGDLGIVVVCNDLQRWQKISKNLPRVEVIEKPIGAWSIHSVMQRMLGTTQSNGKGSSGYVKDLIEENSIDPLVESDATVPYGSSRKRKE